MDVKSVKQESKLKHFETEEEWEGKSNTPNRSLVKGSNIPQLSRHSHIKNINIDSAQVLEKSVLD